jgi:threonine 3-dehydrogenase
LNKTTLLTRAYLNTQTRYFSHALHNRRVLVAGCKGQIGVPLVHAICEVVGKDNVVAADISDKKVNLPCKYEQLDVTDAKRYD